MIIGITGGIGSGKSVISRIVRCNGFPVYDCDTRAKFLMKTDARLRSSLTAILGKDAYNKDGDLRRDYIAGKIFSDSAIRKRVNEVVHSAVRSDIKNQASSSESPFFIETAILTESKLSDACDMIWLIEAPTSTRIQRIERRDSLTRNEIISRLKSQEHEFEKLPKDKVIIFRNDGVSPILQKVLTNIDKCKINIHHA